MDPTDNPIRYLGLLGATTRLPKRRFFDYDDDNEHEHGPYKAPSASHQFYWWLRSVLIYRSVVNVTRAMP